MSNLEPAPEHDACGVGFLADLSHRASHDVIRMSLEAAAAMAHRGARAADGRTGDGAGLLVETPRALFLRELTIDHIRIPERHIGAVCLFLPRDFDDAANARAKVEAAVRLADVAPLRWRVPTVDPDVLGEYARRTAPPYEQLLVDMGPGNVRERMRVVRQLVWRTVRDLPGAVLVSASAIVGWANDHSSAPLTTAVRRNDPLSSARLSRIRGAGTLVSSLTTDKADASIVLCGIAP